MDNNAILAAIQAALAVPTDAEKQAGACNTLPITKIAEILEASIRQGTNSLYSAFVERCCKSLPVDAEERYQWLRNNGYVVRDEDDICVYVSKVAQRHEPKFKWLYDNLFREYPAAFQNELDLVVWGCGCGLDLLALYDRAMNENNPQLWLMVRSVTLVDKSDVALACAKNMAETIFPYAKGRINAFKYDFRKSQGVDVKIPPSFIYTPRLHLISNVLDLLSEDELEAFVQRLRSIIGRYRQTGRSRAYFNEMFVAFSPEYRNWDWESSTLKMKTFRAAWGQGATDVKTAGGEPSQCAYVAFALNDCRNSPAYKKYVNGNRCLRNLVRGRNRCLDEGCDDRNLDGLHSALNRLEVNGKNFLDSYEFVEVQSYDNPREHTVQIERILFVPRGLSNIKPCVVYFVENERINPVEKAWQALVTEGGSVEETDLAEKTLAIHWSDHKFAPEISSNSFLLGEKKDFSCYFVIDPKSANPLPNLEHELDTRQKDIVLGRQQLRRIRGGAGCGKTTTMLWRGVMSVLRTHQPVLMACRTVTLFAHNQRRMAATLLSQVPGLEYVEKSLIKFYTIDKFLCEHIKTLGKCNILRCGSCRRRSKKHPNSPILQCCKSGNPYIPKCPSVSTNAECPRDASDDLSADEEKALCKSCKIKVIKDLCARTSNTLIGAPCFGSVMVDEIQSISPDMVQALFNLTEAGNAQRDFYAFCDERQSLKSESLETDVEVKKFRVKTPKTSGNARFNSRWVTLKKPYRQIGEMSGTLTEVAAAFQALTDAKYGDNETERQPYQPGLVNVFAVEMVSPNAICEKVVEKISEFKARGESKITVVCDSPGNVYSLLGTANQLTWLSTHRFGATFLQEQRLRNEFEEVADGIGLTTIELAQGWDLDCVILVITTDKDTTANTRESVFTGITRAKNQLRIIDASSSHWVYDVLKEFN